MIVFSRESISSTNHYRVDSARPTSPHLRCNVACFRGGLSAQHAGGGKRAMRVLLSPLTSLLATRITLGTTLATARDSNPSRVPQVPRGWRPGIRTTKTPRRQLALAMCEPTPDSSPLRYRDLRFSFSPISSHTQTTSRKPCSTRNLKSSTPLQRTHRRSPACLPQSSRSAAPRTLHPTILPITSAANTRPSATAPCFTTIALQS